MYTKIIDSVTISDITSVARINIAQNTHAVKNCREGAAFSLKKTGKTVYNQNGTKIQSDSSHLVFLPKGSCYNYDVAEAGECIMFEVNFEKDQPFDKITALPIFGQSDVYLSAEKAERAWTYKKSGYRLRCISCLYDMLSRICTDSDAYVNSKKYSVIEPSIKYIETNLSDPDISTELLAHLSDISVPYFRKLFFEIYKIPVAKYIESIRIGKACDLLKSDCGSVGYVAECVGYRNIYHFSKAFKKVTGVPPSEMMRRH